MLPATPKIRTYLNADALFRLVRTGLEQVFDGRRNGEIAVADALMSAFAMFSLKDPSLLAFDDRRCKGEENLHSIYQIERVPSDSQLREILDPLNPDQLRPVFGAVFRQLQRGKVLEQLVYFQGCYLLLLDATGYFSSAKIHCGSCQATQHQNGTVTYSHQMLNGVLAHPDFAAVIPFAPEPIQKQDGTTKNDCERNAVRRFLARFRRDHPHLPVIVVEDGLASNGPHLLDLHESNCHYILGAQEGDHTALFQTVREQVAAGQGSHWVLSERKQGVLQHFQVIHQVPLNAANPECLVNVVRYWELLPLPRDQAGPPRPTHAFCWVTDLAVTETNVRLIMRGGRARWKIENETYNTLKDQGYHAEHNYGHGQKNLSVVFSFLMMLAFLVDQVQQLCCPLFRQVRERFSSYRLLWDRMRSLFYTFQLSSMRQLLEALLQGFVKQPPVLDTS
jgi:hypothetical protein